MPGFRRALLADSCYKTFMMTYLAGSEADKRDSFLELYRRTLEEIVAQGLDQDLVLSELNKYEFAFREDLTKAQRGLDLIGKVLPALKHGSDPFEALAIEDLFASIRKRPWKKSILRSLFAMSSWKTWPLLRSPSLLTRKRLPRRRSRNSSGWPPMSRPLIRKRQQP